MKVSFDYKIKEEMNIRDYLLSFYLAKSKVYKLFLENRVLINNLPVKENYLLKIGDVLTIQLDEDIDYTPQNGNIEVLYEDPYYLIINKPRGLIIYEDSKDKLGTVSNLVAGYYKKMGYHYNIRFCHRLDTETTGVLVLCKDILCHSYMNHLISIHEIKREYHLLCQGHLDNKIGRINLPIGHDRHNSKKMVITKSGSFAITNYELLKEFKSYSYVKAILETGRTHQIRLHFSKIGHPLLGDVLYGGDTKYMKYVALHSYKVKFYHPIYKKEIEVIKEEPSDFLKLLGK